MHTCIGSLFSDYECHGRTDKSKASNIRSLVERQQLNSPCYIGDTAGDEQAAVDAGLPFFHAGYGFGAAAHPLHSFSGFEDVVSYFMQSIRKE